MSFLDIAEEFLLVILKVNLFPSVESEKEIVR
jgi:hypothetical protein